MNSDPSLQLYVQMYNVHCTMYSNLLYWWGGGGGLHCKSYVDKSENVRESAIYNQYIYVWMIYTWIFKNIKHDLYF